MNTPFHLMSLLIAFVVGSLWPAESEARKMDFPATIEGIVTDQNGEPLIGVNIQVKGTSKGTSTDFDGRFVLEDVDEEATLVISYIGYQTREVSVDGQTDLEIVMVSDSQMLDEVVVTALGIRKEAKSLGYSVTKVDGREFSTVRESNFMNSLVGKVAGLDIGTAGSGPGSSTRVTIRGNTSIAGDNQPLYVINGIPMDNTKFGENYEDEPNWGDNLSSLNPEDIEEISVLKGATAAALYGTRAKNGAIVITTKSGRDQQGLGVEFSSHNTFDSPNFIWDPILQKEYGQGYGGFRPASVEDAANHGQNHWGEPYDGRPTIQFDGQERPYSYVKDDLLNDFYKTGFSTTNSLSFSGGNDHGSFRLGLTDMRSDGIISTMGMNRNNISFSGTQKATENIIITANADYIKESVNNRFIMSGRGGLPLTVLMVNSNMSPESLKPGYDDQFQEMGLGTDRNATNPYFVLNRMGNHSDKDRFITAVSARWNILDWLFVQGRVGQDFYTLSMENLVPDGTAFALNGFMDQNERKFWERNFEGLIGINKNFSDDFSLDVNLGGNLMSQNAEWIEINGIGFQVPQLYMMNNAKERVTKLDGFRRKINSLFGTAELGYRGFLYLNVTGRNDWFSTLSPESNNYFYPSVGGSFVFSEVLNIPEFIDFGKVRMTYASVGGDTDPYGLNLTYGFRGNQYSGVALGEITQEVVPNEMIKPLSVNEFEVGFDMRMLDNRFAVDMAFYNKVSNNDITQESISGTSGYIGTWVNVGKVRNRGVELLLSGTPVEGKNFSWTTSLNGSFNRSMVLKISNSSNELAFDTPGKSTIKQIEGMEYAQIVGRAIVKDENGRDIIDETGLPLVSDEVKTFGSGVHNLLAGFSNDFRYKNLTLSVLIDGKFGAKKYFNTLYDMDHRGMLTWTLPGRKDGIILDGVTQDGRENDVMVSADRVNNRAIIIRRRDALDDYLFDASFIKLRNVALTYSVPESLLSRAGFVKGASISLVGRNLMLLMSHVPGMDPESSAFSDNIQGVENSALPPIRSVGFNVNLKF